MSSPRLLRLVSDARLISLVREGNRAAFEALYDRHHRAILSFCRHVLGNMDEAEDAVQHTFVAAYSDLMASEKPIQLRAWLFAIARNRCLTIIRSRREQPTADLLEPATEGLAAQVQRRQDLRDLVADLQRLPEEQRMALVLAEMDALSHEQVAAVLGVPPKKVKALVFQARESLLASRSARETDCAEIRAQLSTLTGGALRRTALRRHLRDCAGCREFRSQVDRQHQRLRVVIPVAPTLALKEAVLGGTAGGGVAAGLAGGGLIASSAVKGGALKSLIAAAVAGFGALAATTGLPPLTDTGHAPLRPAHRLGAEPATTLGSVRDIKLGGAAGYNRRATVHVLTGAAGPARGGGARTRGVGSRRGGRSGGAGVSGLMPGANSPRAGTYPATAGGQQAGGSAPPADPATGASGPAAAGGPDTGTRNDGSAAVLGPAPTDTGSSTPASNSGPAPPSSNATSLNPGGSTTAPGSTSGSGSGSSGDPTGQSSGPGGGDPGQSGGGDSGSGTSLNPGGGASSWPGGGSGSGPG